MDTGELELQEQFTVGLQELISLGLDFKRVVQETLREVLGETPSEVLMMAFRTMTNSPKIFAQKISNVFPPATVAIILDLVAKRARSSLANLGGAEGTSQFDVLIQTLGEMPGVKAPERKQTLLHDHRVEDELDRFAGDRTD